jgi:hypothetical protein
VRGWFRTSRNPLTGAPDLRAIGLTALEVAAAMDHLHDKGVLHGVSDGQGGMGGLLVGCYNGQCLVTQHHIGRSVTFCREVKREWGQRVRRWNLVWVRGWFSRQ